MTLSSLLRHAALGTCLFTIAYQPVNALAQGSLTPPGAPAPTMKTLDQLDAKLEKRIPISTVPFTITDSGSYYVTTNLSCTLTNYGIVISNNNVVLDLNGFALIGVPQSGSGPGQVRGSLDIIRVGNGGSYTNIIVRNGSIFNSGGLGVNGAAACNMLCERLTVSGCFAGGIYIARGTVSDCAVLYSSSGYSGIRAYSSTVSGCTVQYCYTGIFASSSTVSHCEVQNCSNDGIDATISGTVTGCTVQASGIFGISTGAGITVSGCVVQGCASSGINLSGGNCCIIGNNCTGNNTSSDTLRAGISISSGNNRIEDNHVTDSGYAGIQVYDNSSYFNNIIIKNSVTGTNNNYLTPGNQIVGPLITTYGTITNVNPWANFSF